MLQLRFCDAFEILAESSRLSSMGSVKQSGRRVFSTVIEGKAEVSNTACAGAGCKAPILGSIENLGYIADGSESSTCFRQQDGGEFSIGREDRGSPLSPGAAPCWKLAAKLIPRKQPLDPTGT